MGLPEKDDGVDALGTYARANAGGTLDEIRKLAENTRYRAECQITACGFWGNFQLIVGGAAAISAAVASASAFSKQSLVAGIFAVVASVLSAVLASVKAGERAANHEHAANQLNLLSERAYTVHALTSPGGASAADLGAEFDRIVRMRNDLATQAPFVNRRLCGLAAYFLKEGLSYFGGPPFDSGSVRGPRLFRRMAKTIRRRA